MMYIIFILVNNIKNGRGQYEFLGIISNKKDFDIIRKKLENALPDEDIILINEKSLKIYKI